MKKVSLTKQLKQLQNDLEHRDKSLSDAYRKIYDLEHEQEKKMMTHRHTEEISRFKNEAERLLEIIRWMVKPSTAEIPFDKPLDEKTPQQKERGW
jgi:predicted patatin/cPLA2 family phospholipase